MLLFTCGQGDHTGRPADVGAPPTQTSERNPPMLVTFSTITDVETYLSDRVDGHDLSTDDVATIFHTSGIEYGAVLDTDNDDDAAVLDALCAMVIEAAC